MTRGPLAAHREGAPVWSVRASGAPRLAAGASAALVAEPLLGLADTAAAGALGVVPQGALALGAGVMIFATWVLNPLLFSATTGVARAAGRGDLSAVRLAASTGASSAVLLGVATAALLLVLAGPLLAVLGGADELRVQARGYLVPRAALLPVAALVLVAHGCLRGARDTTASAVIALGGTALGAVLDLIVVTATSFGLVGIGLANGVTQVAVLAALALRLRHHGLLPRSGELVGPRAAFTGLGGFGPLVLRGVGLGVATLVLAAAAARLGPVQAAAHQVTYAVWILVALALEGWKAASQVLVARAVGVEAPDVLAVLSIRLVRVAAGLGLAAGLVVAASTPVLPTLLAADAATAAAAISLWPIAAAALAVGSVCFTRDGVEFGVGSWRANAARTLRGAAVWILAAVVAVWSASLVTLWIGVLAGLVVRAAPRPVGVPRAPTA